MASDKMLPITAQQPSEGDQPNPFTMRYNEIVDLISATHIVPPDEHFNAEPLFVVVKNILRRSTQIVDNALLGQEPLENLEEKMSRASLDPLLCTLKQLSYEMTCKAPGVETAHRTTISILNKLSTYSWDAKAVLTLAAFALDYEDFLALAKPHSSHQLVEPAKIGELNKIINDMLDSIDSIFEVNRLSNNDTKEEGTLILSASELSVGVYWIIITVVACTTQMYCLKSNKDKTQELLPFAKKINDTRNMLRKPIMNRDFLAAGRMRKVQFKKVMRPPGPYAIEEYTFFCGGEDNRWIEQFSKKVNTVAEDPITKEAHVTIELSCLGKSRKRKHFWKRTNKAPKKTESDRMNQEIQQLLLSFKNENRWAVLTKGSTRVVSDQGTTILKVLEAFEEWKVNVPEKGFEICFKEYHDKFHQTSPLPSTS